MQLLLQHSFSEEGDHWPALKVNADWLSSPQTSPREISVRSVLRLTSLRLALPSTLLPTNKSFTVTAYVSPSSCYPVTFTWALSGNGTLKSEGSSASIRLPAEGIYQLQCTAENAVSSTSSTVAIQAVVSPGPLRIVKRPAGAVRVHEEYKLEACAEHGTDLVFRWHFGRHATTFDRHFSRVRTEKVAPNCDVIQ